MKAFLILLSLLFSINSFSFDIDEVKLNNSKLSGKYFSISNTPESIIDLSSDCPFCGITSEDDLTESRRMILVISEEERPERLVFNDYVEYDENTSGHEIVLDWRKVVAKDLTKKIKIKELEEDEKYEVTIPFGKDKLVISLSSNEQDAKDFVNFYFSEDSTLIGSMVSLPL